MCGTVRPADDACVLQASDEKSQSPRPTLLGKWRASMSPIPRPRGRVLAALIVLTCGISLWIGTLQRAIPSAAQPNSKKLVVDFTPPPIAQVPESNQAQAVSNAAIITEPVKASLRKTEMTQDPAQLWKDVQHGSAEAEVQLAMMYLDGTQVSQNCEQARLLLLAAAKKQNAKSSNLLSHIYAQRCP
jgi:hypothetical protein